LRNEGRKGKDRLYLGSHLVMPRGSKAAGHSLIISYPDVCHIGNGSAQMITRTI